MCVCMCMCACVCVHVCACVCMCICEGVRVPTVYAHNLKYVHVKHVPSQLVTCKYTTIYNAYSVHLLTHMHFMKTHVHAYVNIYCVYAVAILLT